ncbi:hypothetical protein CYLTODRAFT_426645 [Cylindrobasidium torrendii FP15055 ss-10]|uniref:F-box domain-containing protein n=1 Tax=Cylindrobasidium torrendii FP15055 ss-10 TaxID=1314674 RepID=A0A0D7AXV6_9AGAR|nr:hypothetical protein CYLTODRAFT_426645 [Cylindrobasidium torrendii FP15055 ss-10]
MPKTAHPRYATFPPWSQSPDRHPIFGDARLDIVPFTRGEDPRDDPERAKIMRELVFDLKAARAELDVHANALRRALRRIDNQRELCKKLLGNRKHSPLLLVPDDVLSIIFDYCIQSSPPWSTDTTVNEALLTLTHVCAGWRRLLINSPAYWKNTGISLQIDSQHDCTLPLFNMFLERVGSHPFPVRILVQEPDHIHTAFGESVHLWRTLDLTQYDGVLEKDWGYFGFPRPARALERLDFTLILIEGGDTARFFQPFGQFQNLRDLRVEVSLADRREETIPGPPRVADLSETGFPWAQLTTFHLESEYPASDLLSILRACHELQELRLATFCNGTEESDWIPDEDEDDGPIIMEKLTKLTLPSQNLILWALECPVLEILELGCLTECEPLDAFLDACCPPLRILRVESDRGFVAQAREGNSDAYPSIPQVETLIFNSYFPLPFELPVYLSPGPTPLPLLPSCRYLDLNVWGTIGELCTPEFSAPILAFIDARWHLAEERYLESVTLTANGEEPNVYAPRDEICSMPFIQELRAYQCEGLKVTVCVQPLGEGDRYYYMC